MFENVIKFFKKLVKTNEKSDQASKETAKERLHLVLMQDRANVSVDFLELMKKEIIEVIKKYIDVEEESIDVRLTNKVGEDGTTGGPFLYANIPVSNVKQENVKKEDKVVNTKKEEITNKEEVDEKQKEEIIENEEKVENKDIEETKKEKTVDNNDIVDNTDVNKDNTEINKASLPEEENVQDSTKTNEGNDE